MFSMLHGFSHCGDSLLHNPHLGLTDTLYRLYHLSKGLADCVVPQGE